MADYPDWTDSVAIIAAEIMLPIDMQAAYIMMPVDIQAQYLTLDIDIVAQTVGDITVDIAAQSVGNIAVNIAAAAVTLNVAIASSAVTLNVDIKAQTLTNLNIQINAQAVGVYLQPDWNVLQGTDKNETGSATVPDGDSAYVLDYTVTNGKTFYITQWGFSLNFNGAVVAHLYRLHVATYTRLALNGGSGGGSQSFTKPIAVVAGDHIKIGVTNFSAADATGYGSIGGYEI